MNPVRRIFHRLAKLRRREPEIQWKISNLTRQTVLASFAELADHGAQRSKGLLGRNGLAAGEGMWIVHCEAVHTFGMRFAIDLVYVDREKRVRKVRNSVPPWRLSAHSVIELASGAVRESQTVAGDVLEFSPVDLFDESAAAPRKMKTE